MSRPTVSQIKQHLTDAKTSVDNAISLLTPYSADKDLTNANTLSDLQKHSNVLDTKIKQLPS